MLAGAPVGIIGYGVIGGLWLRALAVDYRIYDPWLALGTIDCPAGLPDILECGVITLHAELTRAQPRPNLSSAGSRFVGPHPG